MTLTRQIAALKASIARHEVTVASVRADPREQHDAEQELARERRRLPELEEAAMDSAQWAKKLADLVAEMEAAKHKSRERSIAITQLETAEMWLRKEVGL